MRDLLVLGIFLSTVPFALRHPWVGVLVWTWLSLMNPHRLTFGFAYNLQFAAAAAGMVLLSLVITRDKLRMPWTPPVVILFLFVVWMCVSTALAISPAGSWPQLDKVLKIQMMVAIALLAFQERKQIEMFVWVNAFSVGYYGLKGGLYTITTGGGGRVWGPEGSFIEDNNALAVAIIMVIPLLNYLRLVANRSWVRIGLLMSMLLCALSALGSQSRGALLAIAAMTLVLWYRSDKKVIAGVLIAAAAVALLAFMPQSWEQRMSTINTYEEDGSAMGRINTWKFCANLAAHRITGGGFEIYDIANFREYAPPEATKVYVAHSIYFSVLGEHGFVGLTLFILIWWLTFREAGKLRKASRDKPGLAWVYQLAGMCQVSLVGYLVGGAFLQLAYFDLPYNILVILVVTQRWLREGEWKREIAGPTGSGDPHALAVVPSAKPGNQAV